MLTTRFGSVGDPDKSGDRITSGLREPHVDYLAIYLSVRYKHSPRPYLKCRFSWNAVESRGWMSNYILYVIVDTITNTCGDILWHLCW